MRAPAILALIFGAVSFAWADGGIAIGQIEKDGLRATVFAAPVPMRAGPLDVSVLVQEIPSNQPVTDAVIVFSVRQMSPPLRRPVRVSAWCTAIPPGTRIPATAAHANNKLLRGAYLPIPEPGRWNLTMDLTRGQTHLTADLPLEVAAPLEPLSTWWPLILLVPAAIFLHVWRGYLVRSRRQGRRE